MPDKTSAIYAEAFRLEEEVARLRAEVERREAENGRIAAALGDCVQALAAANARAMEKAELANQHWLGWQATQEALAAARRECDAMERLRARLDEDRSIGKALRVLVKILNGEPTGPGDKRLAAEAISAHADMVALAAPGDGEEGT